MKKFLKNKNINQRYYNYFSKREKLIEKSNKLRFDSNVELSEKEIKVRE